MFMNNRFLFSLMGIFALLSVGCNLDLDGPQTSKSAQGRWEFGAGNNLPGSLRNDHYTFELLSDNDTLNLSLTSPDTEVSLWLYNPLGQLLRQRWGGRTENIFQSNLNSGMYHVVVGTNQRGEAGDYSLEVSGNVSDLTQLSSVTEGLVAEWATNGGGNNFPYSPRNHFYALEITENNSVLDIVLTSDDTDVSLWLFNTLNEQVRQRWGGRSESIVEGVNAGTHLIVAGTNQRGVLDADYALNVNGNFTNLRQIPKQDTVFTSTIITGEGNNNPSGSGNEVYTFDVTENGSAIDVIMESPDFDISLWLYDPLNQLVRQRWGGRSQFMVEGVNTGTYRLVCGTNQLGTMGEYNLSLTGCFTNFEKQ